MALCSAFASAENVTLWEGDYTFDESWSGSIQIGKLDVQAGDQIIITAEPVEAQTWEWGGQVFVKTLADGWGAIAPTVAVPEAGTYTVDITDSEITIEPYNADKYTSTMIKELTESGLVLQGIDAKVTKVELVQKTESAPSSEETLWEGEYTFDESWSGSISIGKLDVQAGDKIVITAEPVEAQTWEWGGQVFVKTLADGWGAIAPTVAVPEAGTYTVEITDSEITIEPYNADPYTSTMVKEITEFGLVLQGIDAKVTKVVLVKKAEVAPPSSEEILWEGDYTFDESWSGSVSIGKLDVKAGDKLVITAEPVEAVSWEWGGQVFVKSLADGWGAIAPTVSVPQADAYTVEITDTEITVEPYNADPYTTTMVKELTEYGLVLQGIDAKITKVELIRSGSSAINEIEAAPKAATGIYNLSGQKMTSAKGLCVVNGKLIMVK